MAVYVGYEVLFSVMGSRVILFPNCSTMAVWYSGCIMWDTYGSPVWLQKCLVSRPNIRTGRPKSRDIFLPASLLDHGRRSMVLIHQH